jgi:hypothetical protein
MPGLDRPEPRGDIGKDAPRVPDLDEWDVNPDWSGGDLSKPDLPRPDLHAGRWYQADQKNCPTFCGGMSRSNVASPEQALCMSGEVRPQSGIDAGITFTYGCWNGCGAQLTPLASKSYGDHCYVTGQTQDGDPTDRTVGCFCK